MGQSGDGQGNTILKGRDRRLNPHYAALASHYRFSPMFCMRARGQEKSDAERTVYALERRFATPVPKVQDREELNRHLLRWTPPKERDRVVRGRSESIGEMFQTEKAHAVELPSRPFDACVQQIRQVDKYQTVLFEEVRYSVPRQVAFECATVKAYMDQIVIVHKGVVVARHRRSRTPGDQVLEPTHYLATLGRKPAYLDKTRLFASWQLPAAFMRLREKFRQLYGDRSRHARTTSACCNCCHPIRSSGSWRDRGLRSQADADRRDHRRAESFRASALVGSRSTNRCPHRPDHPPFPTFTFRRRTFGGSINFWSVIRYKEIKTMSEMLLKHNLKTLRLPTMLAEHTRLSREAADSNQGYDDYLLKLTELEVAQRRRNAISGADQARLFPDPQGSRDL